MRPHIKGRSEGQVLLGRITHRYTQRAVARKLGVGLGTVSEWISGVHTPEYEHRKEILAQYRIDMDAWDRAWVPPHLRTEVDLE